MQPANQEDFKLVHKTIHATLTSHTHELKANNFSSCYVRTEANSIRNDIETSMNWA
jgi:hypothetical protein